MAAIVLTLLVSCQLIMAAPIRLIFKTETPEFTHQLTVEELTPDSLQITLNSNSFFTNTELVRIGTWKVTSSRIPDFLNSVNSISSQKPEIEIDRRSHDTSYWISGKQLHLDPAESLAYSEIISSLLLSKSAELEKGFEFNTTSKKITKSNSFTVPKFSCDNQQKQCRFGDDARIAF